MFTSLLALAGGGLGGLLRFVPEVFKFFTSKEDRKHELEMTRLQIEIDQSRSRQQIDVIHAQGDLAETNGQAAAYLEALKSQAQLTGVKWVDGLSATVRPFLTYWWMTIFTIYKATWIYDAWTTSDSIRIFNEKIWTPNDVATLAMILSFWFVDRVFKYHK